MAAFLSVALAAAPVDGLMQGCEPQYAFRQRDSVVKVQRKRINFLIVVAEYIIVAS
jgi:hypothetical protein